METFLGKEEMKSKEVEHNFNEEKVVQEDRYKGH